LTGTLLLQLWLLTNIGEELVSYVVYYVCA
jgi:hypothetical protein